MSQSHHSPRIVGGAWALALSALLAAGLLAGGAPLVKLLQYWADQGKSLFGNGILAVCSLLLLGLVGVALSPWGKVRLGKPDEQPEFRLLSWFAMLFASGMGAGLVFWGVTEPLLHTLHPPLADVVPGSSDSAALALGITFLHWALHPWAIYAAGALVVALVAFRHDFPLLPSTPFRLLWPQARRRLRVLDTAAALGVLFGLAAAIAQGVYQIEAGLQALGIAQGLAPRQAMLALCVLLGVAYTLSASGRIENSIRILSLGNIWMAALLAAVLLWFGPWERLVMGLGDGLQAYAELLPATAFQRLPGSPPGWSDSWTVTYFLSWMSWVPFMSVFLARISRGRTIRSFVCGVVVIPSLVSILWFTILGGNAITLHTSGVPELSGNLVGQEAATLFLFLQHFPAADILSAVAILLVFVFLATSADSGAYVLAMLTSSETSPRTWLKVGWGCVLAVLSLAFVWGGDSIGAVRAMFTLGALPVLVILLAQIISVAAGLCRTESVPESLPSERFPLAAVVAQEQRFRAENVTPPLPEPAPAQSQP